MTGSRSPEELKRDVIRCVRTAAREKSEFRLSRLNGFFEKFKNESKLIQWGIDLEERYETEVEINSIFWDSTLPHKFRTLEYLWINFGLGDAHSDEEIYGDEEAISVLATWVITLHPSLHITNSDLSASLKRIQISNAQAQESARAKGQRFSFPLPVDQLVRNLDQQLGSYS